MNTARGGDASGVGQNGGGYGGGIFNLNGSLSLYNVTVAGNTVAAGTGAGATNTANVGAIYNASVNVGAATPTQNVSLDFANTILSYSGAGSAVTNYLDPGSAGSFSLNATGSNIRFGSLASSPGVPPKAMSSLSTRNSARSRTTAGSRKRWPPTAPVRRAKARRSTRE